MATRMQGFLRALTGGSVGLAVGALCHGILFSPGFSAPALCQSLVERWGLGWAVAATYGLLFALGAAAGVATLPFAQQGRALVLHSLAHFAITAGLWAMLLGLCFGVRRWQSWLLGLGLLGLLYALIWLARWVGWYAELGAIRSKLGLAPSHSLLHWREILPYLPFALVLCWAVPVLLWTFSPYDANLLLPFLIFPVGGFASGLSLGRRQGFCPLYPALCGLLSLPMVFILYNNTALFHCVIVFAAVFLGNGLGALVGRRRERKEGAA